MSGHLYPGVEAANRGDEFFTSDCKYNCGCWMGSSRSGGPKGVDPFGECPNAPADPEPETLKSLCLECGPNVPIDEDGCCVTCGRDAIGPWLEKVRVEP